MTKIRPILSQGAQHFRCDPEEFCVLFDANKSTPGIRGSYSG
jgi:hypothetical protein